MSLYSRALPYLQYADALHASASRAVPRIRIGIAISAPCSREQHTATNDTSYGSGDVDIPRSSGGWKHTAPSPPCNPASWQTRSETEMAALMALAGACISALALARVCARACLRALLHGCVRARIPACVMTCVIPCLPACLPACVCGVHFIARSILRCTFTKTKQKTYRSQL
jgi:hypothetical protein